MVEEITTKSSEETQTFAEQFASRLKGGDIILLYGNLGAGKTTFVQGLAKGVGITHRIISPTFIVLRTYEISVKRKALSVKYFYHVDLYRLEKEKEIEDIGLIDLMGKPDNIVIIEWPEKLGTLLPKNAWKISFETKRENERLIRIEKS